VSYAWDWVNTGDEEYIDGERRTLTESYVVRRPDRSILCFTSRYKGGYERALAIAAAMNQNDSPGPFFGSQGDDPHGIDPP
jgi:S1-C subfamily serine protease